MTTVHSRVTVEGGRHRAGCRFLPSSGDQLGVRKQRTSTWNQMRPAVVVMFRAPYGAPRHRCIGVFEP